jgi:hypothetical protein
MSNNKDKFTENDLKNQSPVLQREYSSEQEILDVMSAHVKHFSEYLIKLKERHNYLKEVRKRFPTKYLSNDDFEDLLILASQAKHQSADMSLIATSVSEELKINLDHFLSYYDIYLAKDALTALNFAKVTDAMREKYVLLKKEVADMRILQTRYEELATSFDKMLRNFTDNEINFRRFLEKKDKMLGLK